MSTFPSFDTTIAAPNLRYEVPTVAEHSARDASSFDAAGTHVYQGAVLSKHFVIDLGRPSDLRFTITARTPEGCAFLARHPFGHCGDTVTLPKTFAPACIATMCQEGCL